MRRIAARFAAAFLIAAFLAPVLGAGAVLADDLRDMAANNTGLADDPETPGPDLYAPRPWGDDVPDMPSLLVLDAPADATNAFEPRPIEAVVSASRDLSPCDPSPRAISARGPPVFLR